MSPTQADAMVLTVPPERLRDTNAFLAREWLVTNGLGGYASQSLLCAATRTYHGLFVPDLPAPWGRTVMIPRVDDDILVEGEVVSLSGVEFSDGRLKSNLLKVFEGFSRERQTPVWRFRLKGRRLEKRVIMSYGHNSVYVEYRLVEGDPVSLRLRPFVTFRTLDAGLRDAWHPPFPLTVVNGRHEMHLCEGAPSLKLCLRPHGGVFVVDDEVSAGIFYRVDQDRGLDHVERLASPGYFSADLAQDRSLAFVASTESWERLECDPEAIFAAEGERLDTFLSHVPDKQDEGIEGWLSLAADQFVVAPGSRLEEQAPARASSNEACTIIAGYHWFTDWGRDTMISLEGLTLCTGRYREARSVLRTFANYVQDGLIPNLFPEGERTGLYHTADATLWYVHAVNRYYQVTNDRETLLALLPILTSVLEHHLEGTRFGIGVDKDDGLLRASAEGYQLTWMDALVDGWVVTPRRGKPVEIQALWYNALRCMAEWDILTGRSSSRWSELAEQVRHSFHERFWIEAGGYLYDVIDGERGDDQAFRPNQLLSISLPHPVLREDRWRRVVDLATDRLLTPVGLRTLSRDHPDYKPRYHGDLRARDAAYHQGTVWAWLIGPFIDAWIKVYKDRSKARGMLDGFRSHLLDGSIGTVSEIFDAEPPYHPRGCIAQAWSVAEVLRAYRQTRPERERV